MAHRFKQELNTKQRQIRLRARRITSLELLDKVLMDARPHLRLAVFTMIQPWLGFQVTAGEVPALQVDEPNAAIQ